jgi:hypothetical protein
MTAFALVHRPTGKPCGGGSSRESLEAVLSGWQAKGEADPNDYDIVEKDVDDIKRDHALSVVRTANPALATLAATALALGIEALEQMSLLEHECTDATSDPSIGVDAYTVHSDLRDAVRALGHMIRTNGQGQRYRHLTV